MPTRRDRGSATAETAVVLPALVLVTVLCLWAVASVAAQVRCLDAARTGARALARGESTAAVTRVVEGAALLGAEVRLQQVDAGLVAVDVRTRLSLPGPWGDGGPGVTVGGRVVAAAEDAAHDG